MTNQNTRENFFKFLLSRFEQIHATDHKSVVFFDKKGNEVDLNAAKWRVTKQGIVSDLTEKIACKAEKYSANTGIL